MAFNTAAKMRKCVKFVPFEHEMNFVTAVFWILIQPLVCVIWLCHLSKLSEAFNICVPPFSEFFQKTADVYFFGVFFMCFFIYVEPTV